MKLCVLVCLQIWEARVFGDWVKMHTRYMERTNSMARGKRALEGGEEQQPERKRPALAR